MTNPTLAELHSFFVGAQPATEPSTLNIRHDGEMASDEIVLARMFASKHGNKFRVLWEDRFNIHPGYKSQSEADLALMNDIAYFSGNREQAKRLFRSAPSYRPGSYDGRQDLIDKLIAKAFDGRVFGGTTSISPAVGETPIWPAAAPISLNEFIFAKATAKPIVKDLIYGDVGTLIAAGATGKTTFAEWLAVHIVLGKDVAGRKILSPGKVVILTAEDSRPILVARLRRIFTAMFPHGTISKEEWQAKLSAVLAGIIIIDVSADVLRLTHIVGDVVRVNTAAVDALIASLAPLGVALLLIDPAVSFGVGEGRVNDAEQALIEAGRRIRTALDCAVIYIHHTGKANAREKTKDQYSGRGGSAFADGSRMVFVMNRLDAAEWSKETGLALERGEVGLELSIAKLSHCGPQAPIFLARDGFKFRHVRRVLKSDEQHEQSDDARVLDFIQSELAEGRCHSRNTLEKAKLEVGLSRQKLRDAVVRLVATSRLSETVVPGQFSTLTPAPLAADTGEDG